MDSRTARFPPSSRHGSRVTVNSDPFGPNSPQIEAGKPGNLTKPLSGMDQGIVGPLVYPPRRQPGPRDLLAALSVVLQQEPQYSWWRRCYAPRISKGRPTLRTIGNVRPSLQGRALGLTSLTTVRPVFYVPKRGPRNQSSGNSYLSNLNTAWNSCPSDSFSSKTRHPVHDRSVFHGYRY
jgi:hypothetical protein